MNVNMCPDCCMYPGYSMIDNTTDYRVGCQCGWSCFGHTLEDAVRCWNDIMAEEHPIIGNFEPIDIKEIQEVKP